MHKKVLNIRWLDDAGISVTEKLLPKDLLIKNGEEFLVAEAQDNREVCIRLDKITLLE